MRHDRLNLSILENLPEAAVYVVLGRITAINPMAAHYLPQLEIDGPVPGYLDLPRYGPKGVARLPPDGPPMPSAVQTQERDSCFCSTPPHRRR